MTERELSDPITLRLPQDVLSEIEEVAAICERSRSWVMVRALKSYLAAEGREIRHIAQPRRDLENGLGTDRDEAIAAVDAIIKGAAA